MMNYLGYLVLLLTATVNLAAAAGEDFVVHTFQRQRLTDIYFSEGAAAGDLNNDGHVDVVYGPYWFAGPSFHSPRAIYPPRPQPRERYADHFFAWIYDFNHDGWNDVFVVGFPGTPAFVYENPGGDQLDTLWRKQQVFDWVSNESPHFANLVGDDRPELVCTRDGFFGYATIDWSQPLSAWMFHPVSARIAPEQFGHGLGVGDVNGDGRTDILTKDGWFEQPEAPDRSARWRLYEFPFTERGGAEMYAYDVDGDGDNDVITSLAAHEYGLAWFEQVREGDAITFRKHLIMGDQPHHNRYGVVFSELHSVALADIDGDGLKDIVTGKTYWSHHMQSPMWDAGAVVCWFRLVRRPDGVDWLPYRADDEAGIGRQIVVHDLNQDALPDIVVGGMKGAHVLVQQRHPVSQAQWQDSQPKVYAGPIPAAPAGQPPVVDPETGRVAGATEGEELTVLGVTAGETRVQDMANFPHSRWSGQRQLYWTGAKPGDRLDLGLSVAQAGTFDIQIVLTRAVDYATVQFRLDGQALGEQLDLYHYPEVITSDVLSLGQRPLTAGPHRLSVEIVGANASAVKAYMVGVDFVRLVPR